MLYAADFRARARMALSGKWTMAVIAGLITMLLTGSGSGGPELSVRFEGGDLDVAFELFGQTVVSTAERHPGLFAFLAVNFLSLMIAAVVLAVVFGVIGSTVSVGYARFNLDLADGHEPELGTLFSGFPHIMKTAFCAHFLMGLYQFLWSLLFLIPGIVAGLSYAMTDYILAEHPDMTASEAITASKALMYGNRWRLFCLRWSFIGWSILCAFTMGIGNLWLYPYQEAAYTAFYRSLR